MSKEKSTESSTVDDILAEQALNEDAMAADVAASQSSSAPQDGDSEQTAALRQQLREEEQRVLRVQADLDNFRKRTRRELDESIKYASLPLIRELLPVIDNLQRALDSQESEVAASGLLAGLQMVVQQLSDVLAQHGCREIAAEGQMFDPMHHEAVLQQPSDQPPGEVIQVTQAGYQLHDRVIRPTQVIVSQGPAGS